MQMSFSIPVKKRVELRGVTLRAYEHGLLQTVPEELRAIAEEQLALHCDLRSKREGSADQAALKYVTDLSATYNACLQAIEKSLQSDRQLDFVVPLVSYKEQNGEWPLEYQAKWDALNHIRDELYRNGWQPRDVTESSLQGSGYELHIKCSF